MKKPKKMLKFVKLSKRSFAGSIIALAALSFAYYVILQGMTPIWKDIVLNILVVIISILATNILTGLFTERQTKNQLMSDLLANDVLAADEFLDMLSEENKNKLAMNVDKNLHFSGDGAKSEMLNQARSKIKEFPDIYYSSCVYTVKCTIFENRIEKHIKKTMKIRSSKHEERLPNVTFCSMSFASAEKYPNDKKPHVQINGKQVDEKDIRVENQSATHNPYNEKSGYTTARDYVYAKPLTICPTKDTTVIVESDTVVPINDLTYICRMKRACKRFELQYMVTSRTEKKYRVNSSAFGFVDNASGTTNTTDDPTHVNIKFDDWIFPEDGVAITMVEEI